MLQGQLMLQQCLPAPAPLLTQEAPWSTSACWIASLHGTSGNPKNDGGAKLEARIIFISLCNDSTKQRHWYAEFSMFCCVRQKSSQRTEEKWYGTRTYEPNERQKSSQRTEEKWYGTHTYTPNESWNHVADLMMVTHRERESADILYSEEKCVVPRSIHYNGNPATAELLLRIIMSVNQLSISGAVADWCGEFVQQISDPCSSGTGKLGARTHRKIRKPSRRDSCK